jgi:hypothetical protein
MLTPEQVQRIQPKLTLVQIVAGALIFGALAFAAGMSLMVDWGNLNDELKMLTMMASGSSLLLFVMSIFVPVIFAGNSSEFDNSGTPPDDASVDRAVPMLISETLIRYSLIEGGVFLNLTILIIEPHVALIVVTAIGLLVMLALFPRRSKMISTIEKRARIGGPSA